MIDQVYKAFKFFFCILYVTVVISYFQVLATICTMQDGFMLTLFTGLPSAGFASYLINDVIKDIAEEVKSFKKCVNASSNNTGDMK